MTAALAFAVPASAHTGDNFVSGLRTVQSPTAVDEFTVHWDFDALLAMHHGDADHTTDHTGWTLTIQWTTAVDTDGNPDWASGTAVPQSGSAASSPAAGVTLDTGAADGTNVYVRINTVIAGGSSPGTVNSPHIYHQLTDDVANGAQTDVDNDEPSDAVNVIRDYGLENAPIIIGVIGAIFLVGLTFSLVRRGLMKARGAMRL